MPRFTKKPATITADQWFKNGDHPEDHVGEWIHDVSTGHDYEAIEGQVVRFYRHPDVPGDRVCENETCDRAMDDHGWIDTLEGGHTVCPGDWIITGIEGERYPCKPRIFAGSYDPASDD